MNIHDYYTFKSVVRKGSLSKAAHELNYAQSNVTMKIQSLEKFYNTTLFYRHHRGITLTPKGEVLFEAVNKILHLYEESLKMMGDEAGAAGPLRIGSMETTAALHLPSLLTTFHRENTEVDLTVVTGPSKQSIQKVEAYELDGAFVAGPVYSEHLKSKELVVEELVLITSEQHPPIQSLKELEERTLIVFRNGCSYRAILEQWLHTDGIVPKKIMEFGTLDGLIGCVAAGLGASLLPLSIVLNYEQVHRIHYHKIEDKQAHIPTLFVYRQDDYESIALQHFLQVVEEYRVIDIVK